MHVQNIPHKIHVKACTACAWHILNAQQNMNPYSGQQHHFMMSSVVCCDLFACLDKTPAFIQHCPAIPRVVPTYAFSPQQPTLNVNSVLLSYNKASILSPFHLSHQIEMQSKKCTLASV